MPFSFQTYDNIACLSNCGVLGILGNSTKHEKNLIFTCIQTHLYVCETI